MVPDDGTPTAGTAPHDGATGAGAEPHDGPPGAGTAPADLTDLPAVAGVEVEHRFVDLPGLRMHLAEAGSGQPLLLLHGSPKHWWQWAPVIPGLARHYRVICPDMRGCGWTDAPAGGYTREQLLADTVALLDAVGAGTVLLASTDMGSITGYALCWEHPDRVERHVAIGVPPFFIRMDARLLPRFRHLWHQEALAVPGLGPALAGGGKQRVIRHMLAGPGLDPAAVAATAEVYLAPLRQPDRARAKSAMLRRLVLPEVGRIVRGTYRGRRLRTPTLVLAGTVDPVFSPDVVRGLLADAAEHADHVELAAVEGAGHYLVESAPAATLDLILRFFSAA
ncbi:alpha/beta hydrolase [Georgenia sp. TF02-10]|uniref:alpha/beta fold hydrolase n=1 Tax=Georgenia sp. TF02-10 TaxID=2917725 RepID=UPI001FA7BAD9|nr:alpha/beta hydrolase [Georgenia sp. TF02-10]UNX55532.1 alpha/beta hydrolase [Georgenia sp. TF02-10]